VSVSDLVAATSPFADDADRLTTYAWLVGSWDVDAIWFDEAGGQREMKGEWHFTWILGGRAIQDVLFGANMSPDRFGTTLRCYDRAADLWHIFWAQPVGGEFVYLQGRRAGENIVQEGRDRETSRLLRWTFTEITQDSFTWTGEVSADERRTWFLEQEMRGRRRPADPYDTRA
jgi:hypothetical protein